MHVLVMKRKICFMSVQMTYGQGTFKIGLLLPCIFTCTNVCVSAVVSAVAGLMV